MNCSKCNSSNIAEILWGYHANMKELEKKIEMKKIVLGGCIISGDDPKWQCNKCHNRWGEAEHNDEVNY